LSQTHGHIAVGIITPIKNSNDTIGNRTQVQSLILFFFLDFFNPGVDFPKDGVSPKQVGAI
jgi:hypothetical protein